jgi:glycogen debranching enzyme
MMRRIFVVLLGVLSLSGCKQSEGTSPERKDLTLDELAVVVRETPRQYMLSDRGGAFLTGAFGGKDAAGDDRWALNGELLLDSLTVRVGSRVLGGAEWDSAVVYPDRVTRFYRGGAAVTVAPIEGFNQRTQPVHAIVIDVAVPTPSEISFVLHPVGARALPSAAGDGTLRWRTQGAGWTVEAVTPPGGRAEAGVLTAGPGTSGRFLVCASKADPPAHETLANADSLRRSRAARLTAFLNGAYARTSDAELTKALCWMKLSIDAMVVQAQDTFCVASVPWDGSLSGRDNAQSIAGIGLATGDYPRTAAILRSLGKWQETDRSRTTYGRIANQVVRGIPRYNGADVGPWYVREMYEYITYANDTTLVRAMFPLVKRSIEGTVRYHTDRNNLLVHGDDETWMSAWLPDGRHVYVPRGNRAVEIQLLWYFQQLIGSFMASYVGDSADAAIWADLAKRTSAGFDHTFVDTVRNIVYDHVAADGTPSTDARPNPMFTLEIIGSEVIQQSMIRGLINRLVYQHGFGTLDHRDQRFHAYASLDESMFDGPIWTWLAGQLAYTLSRYDRQDFSYRIMESMVKQVLRKGMVGALPAMMDVLPRPGMSEPEGGGSPASLTAMAEFVRAFYQDYMGLRLDAASNQFYVQPKLPDHLTMVDFTVRLGSHPILGRLERGKETSRIILTAPTIARDLRVGFFWMLDNGDAWRGSTMLSPKAPLTIAIGPDDVIPFHGEKRTAMIGQRKLRQFSQRTTFTGIDFVDPTR